MSIYRTLVTSDHVLARAIRSTYWMILHFSIPAPKPIFKPLRWVAIACREVWYFVYRVFVCEPLFKAYCRQVGRNVHTGVYFPYIEGRGDLIIGNNVTIDGKCGFSFAARFAETPTLIIGDNTGIGHGCEFAVGNRIAIGESCRIANNVRMFDSPGHPLNPEARKAGRPPDPQDVRPITIGNNVWIGVGAVIFPGTTIGENSIVSTHAVVMGDVPANTLVAGNPARKMLALEPSPAVR